MGQVAACSQAAKAAVPAVKAPVPVEKAVDGRLVAPLPAVPTVVDPVDNREAIKLVLDAYRESYDRLDAPSAAPHVLRLSWTIDFERSADRWVIASVKAD